jgi:hypothetical protein
VKGSELDLESHSESSLHWPLIPRILFYDPPAAQNISKDLFNFRTLQRSLEPSINESSPSIINFRKRVYPVWSLQSKQTQPSRQQALRKAYLKSAAPNGSTTLVCSFSEFTETYQTWARFKIHSSSVVARHTEAPEVLGQSTENGF